MEELLDPDEDTNNPHDSIKKYIIQEVLNIRECTCVGVTTGLGVLRDAINGTQHMQ